MEKAGKPMILDPPAHFDSNEWFIMGAAVVVLTICWMLPRRWLPVQTIFLVLFNLYLGKVGDYLLAIPPVDLYDANDTENYEIFDFLLYVAAYPPVVYIMLNVYDKWRLKGMRRVLYIAFFALLTMGLEWLALLAHVFTYKGWHIGYSFFVYCAVYVLNVLVFHWVRRVIIREKGHADPQW
ncbi:hypothetical protein [Paenibacillus whitsoniae]|uniref:Uncharacterized protein n=1 Tax=Paenibacillus whitsoniae TaxID=2496558 RepID=A0A3S0A415_9BACL|nr:hypothetical protein [Paenibacillus whitsoniae]RTE09087.1 hypothetical protein EJQ19_14045 [Paenibacillus whitsoniae]